MPILRNPFARRPGGLNILNDENSRPGSSSSTDASDTKKTTPGFERVDTMGSKASMSALSVRSGRSQDTGEYKMSVVNDSGVYLPPSPSQEKEPAWPRRYLSRNSTDNRSDVGEIEHFSISRESFDSYRRSFDISARSPIPAEPARQSLDSARFPRMNRTSMHHLQRREPPMAEEGFEDVGLNDEASGQKAQLAPPQQQKRRGFFSKFGSDAPTPQQQDVAPGAAAGTNMQAMSRFLPGRKRGHSGQGAELGAWPATAAAVETQQPQQQQQPTTAAATALETTTREEIAA